MKSCVIRRRFHTSEAAGAAVTVNLETGFGVPKACLIMFTETAAATDSFDTTLALRNVGIGMIGSTSSSVTSTLRYQCVWSIMTDNTATSSHRRQNSNTRYLQATNTAGTVYWQASSATFSTDVASFVITSSTPQTNGHLDCIMTFFGGDDLTVGIGTHLMPTTAGGSNSFSALPFQPDIIIAATSITAINSGLTDDFRLCFGAVQRTPFIQYGTYLHGEGTGAVDLGTVASNSAIFTYSTSNAVGPYTMTINSINSNGFTMTSSDAAAGTNNFMMFMALKSSTPTDFALMPFSSPTGTGDSFTGTGSTGFVPKCIIGSAVNATTFGTRDATSPGADSIQLFGGNRSADSLYWPGFGTIQTVTSGTAVTGSGTFFHRLAPGDKIYRTDNTLIGTISSITSNTAMTLTSNAANTNAAGTSYVSSNPGQYCISYGNQDAATTSVVFSRMSSKLIDMARSSANTPSSIDVASLTDFDSRNGYNLNFTTASGSSRKGWILAMKDTENANENRRRKNLTS